ncbi:LPS export ABC transporter permease LptG [Granulosicoccus antarcticus]|uniref:Lipopolysaccharide export system permease protein LptG n=1 Tax=Granulosicoccus antarcticus IMCC3135 TaxID=1192854 RepID=A0A2Z2P1E6_9GAMM|nr:LPS export ABC transporter permease LptG [Granulosicoccus antarcticus]ASJ75050.1 Lipopolysaccharide export system permease protein LptG [Granulosicoccus antarcticus IMCC3135]
MFGILDRYIGRSILLTSLLVLMTLVTLASIFAFISELDDVGKGSYTVTDAVQYVFLTIPGKAYMLFSPAVLLGSLLGLGGLASNSELTVMRAAGISGGRIIRAVVITGVGLMLLIALLGETIMPRAEQIAEELRLTALEKRLSVKGSRGLWLKSADQYVNVGTVMPDFTLLDVSVHRFDSNALSMSMSAARAQLQDDDDWLLEDVKLTRLTPSDVVSEQLKSITWTEFVRRNAGTTADDVKISDVPDLVSADVLKSISVSTESLSANNLHDQIQYLKENQLDSRRIELAFWVKIASPLSTLVMLMLSLPFVFASQRTGGAGQKIFIGIMLGIIYVLLNKLLTQLALANGLSPLLSALLPLIVFLGIALVGIKRTT